MIAGDTIKKAAMSTRALTSLIAFTAFMVMTITGLVLYFVPQGRVAYWVDWKLIGLTKTDWGNMHTIASIVFAIAGGFHLYLNWKPLMHYLSGKIEKTLKFRKELVITSIVTVLILVGSIILFPPFNYVIDFSEYLKGAWIKSKDYEPPFGHAEEVSLRIFVKKVDIDLDKAVAELKAQGIRFESADEKLKDIAQKNNITPMDVYILIKKYEPKIMKGDQLSFTPELVEEKFAGTGIGRKQFSWIVEDVGIDKITAKKRLSRHGIDITDNETLKSAASRYGRDPIEILKAMLIEDYVIQR